MFVAALLLLQACYRDEGNYAYSQINEVNTITFDPVMPDNGYSTRNGRLTIRVHLESTIAENEDNYIFQWIIFSGAYARTFATTRDLNATSLGVTTRNEAYEGRFRVTDKTTGVMFEKPFKVRISNKISTGYLVMFNHQDTMRLDMLWRYSEEDVGGVETYHPVLDVLNASGCDMPQQRGPYKIADLGGIATALPGNALSENNTHALFLLSQTGAERITYTTFRRDSITSLRNWIAAGVPVTPADLDVDNMVFSHKAGL